MIKSSSPHHRESDSHNTWTITRGSGHLILEDLDTLQASARSEQQQLEQQRATLTAQREKLLQAHYAGAIPLDLLKVEQDRIASQLGHIQSQLATTDANFEQARSMLANCLDFTRDCHAAYMAASDKERRLFNQAFFTKIYIDEDDLTRERSVRVDYQEPFDILLSRLVPAHQHRELAEKTRENQHARQASLTGGNGVDEVQGSHTSDLVELRGLEPLTPSMPWRCATSCATAPSSSST